MTVTQIDDRIPSTIYQKELLPSTSITQSDLASAQLIQNFISGNFMDFGQQICAGGQNNPLGGSTAPLNSAILNGPGTVCAPAPTHPAPKTKNVVFETDR